MNWGAHEVDGRIAAKAAVKIRAALRQSIDAKRVYELYVESDPVITDNPAQDNARARAWAMLNVRPNNNAVITALQYLWAEAFILGEDSAKDAIRQARELKKAPEASVNWDDYHPTKNPLGWRAGDRASALLITPPRAFQRLLEKQGVVIKGLDKTGYDRVGTALARSVRLGLGSTSAAREINNAIGDPARALTIAITETSRAVSLGAIKTYKEAHLEKMEWAVSDPCPECAQNSGQVIDIGGTFNSGAQQPPAHPHCRCAILPVIPDYETNEAGVVDVMKPTTGAEPMPYKLHPKKRQDDFEDRFRRLSPDQRAMAEEVMNEAYQEVAAQPLRINISGGNLDKVLDDGRFKSAFEKTGQYSEYMDHRKMIETDWIGIPTSTKDSLRPIYGSLSGEASMYGTVEVHLKDAVKTRTTMTLGDSFLHQNPVSVTDVLSGVVSREDLTYASALNSTSKLSDTLRLGTPVEAYDRFMKSQSYWEAQIYGGVKLSDIDTVFIDPLDKDNLFLVEKLKAKGIKVEIKSLQR